MRVAYYNESIRCYSDGRIERLFRGKYWREVTQTSFNTNGYLMVGIDGKMKSWHRVVWEAFNGNIPDGLTINHKDEAKTNNSLDNLELMTVSENNRYGTRNKRIGETNKNNGTYKRIAEKRSKPVIGVNIKTGEKIEFPSTVEAGRNGFNRGHICSCIRGKRKSHKGYKWYFREEYYYDE